MRALVLGVALCGICLPLNAAWAQVHVFPDQNIGSRAQAPLSSNAQAPLTIGPPQPPEDLYRAGPDTYAPRFDGSRPHHHRRFPPLGYGYLPGVYVPSTPAPPVRVEVHVVPRETIIYRPAPEPPKPKEPVVVAPPPPPKTFYVIPGCYAGDRPPVASQLPAGCDIARLRRIDPPGRT